jgi:hypothetical protein
MTALATIDQRIRAAIAEASGAELPPDDPLPGQLGAIIHQRGIGLDVLMLWIHDRPRHEWSARAFVSWSGRYFAALNPLPPAA